MVYKTKLMVGVPSLTHIPTDISLRPYIYSPGYIWAQGSTFFLSCTMCISRWKMYSLGRSYFNSENFKKSVVWYLHWDSHSPRTWTLLTWPTYNMNRGKNRQRHHVIYLTCNQVLYFFWPNDKTQVWFRKVFKDDLTFTQWLALFSWLLVN